MRIHFIGGIPRNEIVRNVILGLRRRALKKYVKLVIKVKKKYQYSLPYNCSLPALAHNFVYIFGFAKVQKGRAINTSKLADEGIIPFHALQF